MPDGQEVLGPRQKKWTVKADRPKDISELKRASELSESGEPDEAWDIVKKHLTDHPHDPRALVVATHIYDKSRNLPVAYYFARAVVELSPEMSAGWLNVARIAEELYLTEEALDANERALSFCKPEDKEHRCMILVNLAALHVTLGNWTEAERVAREVLKMDPNRIKARGNLGIACLAQRKWREGWWGYSAVVNSEYRKGFRYGSEEAWTGEKGQTVVIYGEQGLGDEISFASMVPDAIKDCKKVILDCDARLAGIFRRSFPQATVYGTRWVKELDWADEDKAMDASLAIGELGQFYRRKDSDFPGTPYLVPDPVRLQMWKQHFSGKGKPIIGLAWTGGVQWTGKKFRRWSLDDLLPIFNAVDAHWVCLQYKDASEEIESFRKRHPEVDIAQYSWATLTNDYDDTAALVASCDQVISMQTAVVHLAGALGVPTWVFVPVRSQWRYAGEERDVPWYKSVEVFHQQKEGDWQPLISTAVNRLRKQDLKAA